MRGSDMTYRARPRFLGPYAVCTLNKHLAFSLTGLCSGSKDG